MIITIPSFGLSKTGGDRILTTLANNLVKRGHKVSIVNLGSKPIPYTLSDEVSLVSVPFEVSKKDMLNYGITGINELASNLLPSDIYLANFVFTVLPCIANLDKGHTIFLAQANEARDFEDKSLKIFTGISYEAYKLNIPIVTPSSYLQKMIKERFKNNARVIPPFVDNSLFKPDKTKHVLGNLKLLFVGNIKNKNKGFDILLEACKKIKGISFELHVATQNDPPENIEGIDIKMHKPESDEELSNIYRTCDVFINLSEEEGFGLTLLEAMASGLICIATDSGGINDFAINNRNFLLVKRNSDAVASMIETVNKNYKYYQKRLTNNAIKTARGYSEKKMVDSFEKLFKQVCKM